MRNLFVLFFFLSACSSIKAPSRSSGIIIAHRGASAFLPEHTLEAYAYAHAHDVDFIEPDVVLTKDNIPICLHDVTLETTTNVEQIFPKRKRKDGHWYAVDFTLDEIKKLNVHERAHQDKAIFPNRFPKGMSSFQVPTLMEFIELIQGLNTSTGKNVGIYPEIKKPEFHLRNGINSAPIIMQILKNYKYDNHLDKIFIQSFHPDTLKKLKTKIPLIQLIGENDWGDSSTNFDILKTNDGLREIRTYANGIGIWLGHIKQDPTLIKRAKSMGLQVHAYTHRPERTKHSKDYYFKTLGLHGVFSDVPSLK